MWDCRVHKLRPATTVGGGSNQRGGATAGESRPHESRAVGAPGRRGDTRRRRRGSPLLCSLFPLLVYSLYVNYEYECTVVNITIVEDALLIIRVCVEGAAGRGGRRVGGRRRRRREGEGAGGGGARADGAGPHARQRAPARQLLLQAQRAVARQVGALLRAGRRAHAARRPPESPELAPGHCAHGTRVGSNVAPEEEAAAEGQLLGEGASPEGERALDERRARMSSSAVGVGVGVQVTSSEALRRKRHSYQEWLAKKRAELLERRKREEEAKRALAPSVDADLLGIVPEVARKRMQERREQRRRVDTNLNLRVSQSAAAAAAADADADEQQRVRPGLGYPSPPPNIHYRSTEPPIPGTRQKLWDQRMAVVAAYTRPITLPSELPAEAGGEPAIASPTRTPAPEVPKEAPPPPKQTSIDRRVDAISERHENPYTQAKQVFDWMPPPVGSARHETRVPFGGRPEGVEPLNLRAAEESSSSPKSGPSSLSPSANAKSPPSLRAAALEDAAVSPTQSSHQPPQVANALVPHPPATPPRSTPRRARPAPAPVPPPAPAIGGGAGPETELTSKKKPSEELKSRPGDWIDALSEFVGAKKEGVAAIPEDAASGASEAVRTAQEASPSHTPRGEDRQRPLEQESEQLGAALSSRGEPARVASRERSAGEDWRRCTWGDHHHYCHSSGWGERHRCRARRRAD